MPQVSFTQNLQRHLSAPPRKAPGATVREALDHVFRENPRLRGYVLDDQNRLRKHVAIFVDGQMIHDRDRLSDEVGPASELFVMQALSGG
jgi:molybdopterin synthase sulfur carrier subunit